MSGYRLPEPLAGNHVLEGFRCGIASLDDWLVKRARANHVSGASRTFVVADGSGVVIAYYSLSTGAILRADAPRTLRQGAPEPVPTLLIGRFAVAIDHQGLGLGRSLLQDALLRCARQSREVGFMAVMTHPVDATAAGFWRRFGFTQAPTDEPMLILSLADLLARPGAPII